MLTNTRCFISSKAIITYLLNKYAPDSELYPKDPAARAQVDQRLYFDSSLNASFRAIVVGGAKGNVLPCTVYFVEHQPLDMLDTVAF